MTQILNHPQLVDVYFERLRQDQKHGPIPESRRNHTGLPGDVEIADLAKRYTDQEEAHGGATWRAILREEVAEAFAESDPELLRTELIQVAAVAVSWVEDIDRRSA